MQINTFPSKTGVPEGYNLSGNSSTSDSASSGNGSCTDSAFCIRESLIPPLSPDTGQTPDEPHRPPVTDIQGELHKHNSMTTCWHQPDTW